MRPLIVVLYASVLAGVVSSAWMLRACSRGPPRLLKKQLFHQAIATFPIDISKAALMTWVLVSSSDSDCIGDPLIKGLVKLHRIFAHAGFFATWLFDMHIAASVAAASLHSPAALLKLGRSLPLVWLVAVAYGAQAVILSSMDASHLIDHDLIGSLLVVLCFLCTIVLYLIALEASRRSHSPNSVVIRTRRRAMVYPLLFIISVFPTFLRYLSVPAFQVCEQPWGPLSIISEHATATLNAVAFYLMNGRRKSERTPREAELSGAVGQPRGAHSVGFDEETEVLEVPAGGSWRQSAQWMRRGDSLDLELNSAQPEGVQQRDAAIWTDYVGSDFY